MKSNLGIHEELERIDAHGMASLWEASCPH